MRQYPNEIAQAIGEALERKKLRPATLARRARVAPGYISEILSGKKGEQIGIHILHRLARGLGMTTSSLVRRIELISEEKNCANPQRVD